jgi:hypothetical protein
VNAPVYEVPLQGIGVALSGAGVVQVTALPTTVQAEPGARVNIDIYIDSANAAPPANEVDTYQFTANWNPSQLQYVSFSRGDAPWYRPSSMNLSNTQNGSIEAFDYYGRSVIGRYRVFSLRFNVIGTPGSSAPFNLTVTRLAGPNVTTLLPILQTQSTTIQIGGSVAPADIAVSPASYNYGDVAVGASASRTFLVKNEGTEPLTVSSVSLSGLSRSQFAITSGSAPFTLAGGEQYSLVVDFVPTFNGTKSASLVLTSNDPDEGQYAVPLSGTTRAPDIRVEPLTVDFGNVRLGSLKRASIYIYNDGSKRLFLSLYAIEGDQNIFAFNAGLSPFVGAGGRKRVVLSFQPTAEGVRNAKFIIASDDPDEVTVEVTMTGNGVSVAAAGAVDEAADELIVPEDDATFAMPYHLYLPTIQVTD